MTASQTTHVQKRADSRGFVFSNKVKLDSQSKPFFWRNIETTCGIFLFTRKLNSSLDLFFFFLYLFSFDSFSLRECSKC